VAAAYYAVPREERRPCVVSRPLGGTRLQGNGLSRGVLWEDFVTIANTGVLQVEPMKDASSFVISPLGRQFYAELTQDDQGQTAQIEEDVWRYFDTQEFQQAYPDTYLKWKGASQAVWSSDGAREFSAVGLLCREAMQAFATELIARHGVERANDDLAATRDRFSAVVNARRSDIGDRKSTLLDALFDYWREVGNLVQRQVHANERQVEELVWDDGRRVVFQLGFVMFEAARTLDG
jgi:hypothetical protein